MNYAALCCLSAAVYDCALIISTRSARTFFNVNIALRKGDLNVMPGHGGGIYGNSVTLERSVCFLLDAQKEFIGGTAGVADHLSVGGIQRFN